jgi:hypothetical protein
MLKKLLFSNLKLLKHANLVIHDGEQQHVFGSKKEPLKAEIVVKDQAFYKYIIFGGSIGASEAYMNGYWSSPNLTSVIRVFAVNQQLTEKLETKFNFFIKPLFKLIHYLNKNSIKLKEHEIPSIEITSELAFQYNNRLSGVSYRYIPGKTYRDLGNKITKAMITDLAKYISIIHKKGIYFRAMHLGNILLHNKKLFLIDIAKIHFYPWPLFIFTRARAFRRMIKYQDDIKHFGLINYKNLISEYMVSSKFNHFERIRFQLYLAIFSKIKYKYFKKILGATILLVVLLWLI